VTSLAEPSLEPEVRRSHGALYDAPTAGSIDTGAMADLSAEVLPVAGLPMQALDSGAHLIIINNTPTYVNVRADVVVMDDVASMIPEITKRVLHG